MVTSSFNGIIKEKKLNSFAKINLYLSIHNKRDDGFHSITTLFQTIDLHDTITIKYSTGKTVFKTNASLKWNNENLLYRVVEELEKATSQILKLSISLEKNIPPKAGLGGGSSNAATLLKHMGRDLNLPYKETKRIAEKLGSDVPFFLKGGTAIGRGRGELLEFPGDLSGYYVKLHFPDSTVSTSEAYSMFDESGVSYRSNSQAYDEVKKLWEAFKYNDYETIKKLSRNDFEDVVFMNKPSIFSLFRSLDNSKSIIKRMTGSGSTIYELYPEHVQDSYTFAEGVD
ncbi:MAG: 4-(cytidine 5'-diphospho)-2-C-methyl-D-erythritol kinase [Thermotogota bacterium]|nr:4-(cytidine 5'-diphospho)-2-C-methyl-D-erythritol kinase [Thermotogota bacterium]